MLMNGEQQLKCLISEDDKRVKSLASPQNQSIFRFPSPLGEGGRRPDEAERRLRGEAKKSRIKFGTMK